MIVMLLFLMYFLEHQFVISLFNFELIINRFFINIIGFFIICDLVRFRFILLKYLGNLYSCLNGRNIFWRECLIKSDRMIFV